MRSKASRAEETFLGILLGEQGVSKEAIDLDPNVADALGIPSVSSDTLDELESHATQPAQAPPATPLPHEQPELDPSAAVGPSEEQPTEPAPVVDVGGFDPVDAPPVEEEAASPPLPTRQTHGRLFTTKRSHPLQMLEVLTMRYGTEWADWESDTLWWALRRDFGPVGELARNKILALRLAATTDVPWLDWDVFEDSGLSWNDIIPTIGEFQPMTPAQMGFAVQVLHGIRSDEAFDPEVKAYIAAILDEHGWVYAPPEYFDGAQELLDRKVWTVGLREQVKQAWEALRDVDPAKIEWRYDHPLDIHILKLMAVKHYVDGRNALRNLPIGASASASTTAPPVP